MRKRKQDFIINILIQIGIMLRKERKIIKSLMYLKTVVSCAPIVLFLDNCDTIPISKKLLTPLIITLHLWFNLPKHSKYSQNHFQDYLKNECCSTIFFESIKVKKK